MRNQNQNNQEDLEKVRPVVTWTLVIIIFLSLYLGYPLLSKLVPKVNSDLPQQAVEVATSVQSNAIANDGSIIVEEKRATFKMAPFTNRPTEVKK